MIRILLSLCL